MSTLNTTNPIALRYLMSETLFSLSGDVAVSEDTPGKEVITQDGIALPSSRLDPVAAGKPAEPKPEIHFLGGNKGHILFVTDSPDYEYMSPAALDAFEKVLGAVKLTLDDVALWNRQSVKQDLDWDDLTQRFAPTLLIQLAVDLSGLGVPSLTLNTAGEHQGIKVFQTSSFEAMLTDVDKKRQFWVVFKSLLS